MIDPTEAKLMRFQPIKGTHTPITVFDEQSAILGAMKKIGSSDRELFAWCPDCDGEGVIYTMSTGPDLNEYATNCERCVEHEGMVKIWPVGSQDD